MTDAQAKTFPSESDAIGRRHTAVETPIQSKQTDDHFWVCLSPGTVYIVITRNYGRNMDVTWIYPQHFMSTQQVQH